eukprot:805169_1
MGTPYPSDCCENVISPGCLLGVNEECISATVDACIESEIFVISDNQCSTDSNDESNIGACILEKGLESDICASDFVGISCEKEGKEKGGEKGGGLHWSIVLIIVIVVICVILVIVIVICKKKKGGRAYIRDNAETDTMGAGVTKLDQEEMELVTS